MRSILWFIYFWLSLVALIPRMRKAKKLEAQGDRQGQDEIVRPAVGDWMRALLHFAGVRISVTGKEHIPAGEPVVFVANHQGYFDIPLLLTQLDCPHPMVAKTELQRLPLIRDWMLLLRCVFLERENPRKAMSALSDAAKLVAQGYSVIIFPEGTRAKSDLLGEFKAGAFKVASKSGARLVPVLIEGSWRIMEGNGNWIRPGDVRLTILPPISTQGLSREALRALPEQVKQILAEARSDTQRKDG